MERSRSRNSILSTFITWGSSTLGWLSPKLVLQQMTQYWTQIWMHQFTQSSKEKMLFMGGKKSAILWNFVKIHEGLHFTIKNFKQFYPEILSLLFNHIYFLNSLCFLVFVYMFGFLTGDVALKIKFLFLK